MKKNFIILTVFILIMILGTNIALGAEPVDLIVENEYVDAKVIIENGRTLVPVRAIFEALDTKVSWDEKTQTVKGVKEDIQIQLVIGKRTALVDGEIKRLDTPAKIYNGSTFVPVRFISESLDAKVDWVEISRTVLINSDKSSIIPKYDVEEPFTQKDFVSRIDLFKNDRKASQHLGNLKELELKGREEENTGSIKKFDKGVIELLNYSKEEVTVLKKIKIFDEVRLGDYFLRDIVVGDDFKDVLEKFPSKKSSDELDKTLNETILYEKEELSSKYSEIDFLKQKGLLFDSIKDSKYEYKGIYSQERTKQLAYSAKNKSSGKEIYKVVFRFDDKDKLIDIELNM